jgi:hypothetical protein
LRLSNCGAVSKSDRLLAPPPFTTSQNPAVTANIAFHGPTPFIFPEAELMIGLACREGLSAQPA